MNESLFPDEPAIDPNHTALIAQYTRVARPLDDLPYTPDLSAMCAQLGRPGDERTVLDTLLRLRKGGKLPKSGARSEGRVKLDAEQEAVLTELVIATAGSMGKRDRLPHTEVFDDLLARFNAECGLSMSAHDLWRVVARLAK